MLWEELADPEERLHGYEIHMGQSRALGPTTSLLEIVQRSIEKRHLVIENRDLRRQLAGTESIDRRLLGNSAAISRLRDEILDVADTDAPVLISGETGTGKEVVARCLYEFGTRSDGLRNY